MYCDPKTKMGSHEEGMEGESNKTEGWRQEIREMGFKAKSMAALLVFDDDAIAAHANKRVKSLAAVEAKPVEAGAAAKADAAAEADAAEVEQYQYSKEDRKILNGFFEAANRARRYAIRYQGDNSHPCDACGIEDSPGAFATPCLHFLCIPCHGADTCPLPNCGAAIVSSKSEEIKFPTSYTLPSRKLPPITSRSTSVPQPVAPNTAPDTFLPLACMGPHPPTTLTRRRPGTFLREQAVGKMQGKKKRKKREKPVPKSEPVPKPSNTPHADCAKPSSFKRLRSSSRKRKRKQKLLSKYRRPYRKKNTPTKMNT